MKSKKDCIAMLLAGGQGSRLYTLTSDNAKPAVPYGSKYRIIDFPLSNCVNSNITTIGVLTQYEPMMLNEYIGNGQPWDLDRKFGGVHILPPYQGRNKSGWYKGTANAIYQNMHFIRKYNPECVLILSGDHIYKMDYNKMLLAHKENEADCTIAVLHVSLKEASRFGIMSADASGRITAFEEKPVKPKSTLASMGIYIFDTQILFDYLIEDEENADSSNDFGKNVIPKMLKDGLKMYTYEFDGYWKDVGTIDSLWEANMDLLGEKPNFDIFDKKWKIYSRSGGFPPQLIGSEAKLVNSLITEGCVINGEIINSIIGTNVIVEKGARIIDSVIFDNTVIKKNAVVQFSIVDTDAVIEDGICVGGCEKISVVGHGAKVKADVAPGSMVEGE